MATQKLVTVPSAQPTQAAAQRIAPLDTAVFENTIGGSIDSVRQEIDDAFADMKTFHNLEPDECMRMAGGHSARLSEIRVKIMRVEDFKREWKNVRTREIEPALEELERQWRNASRLHSVRELDWKMEAGER
jgi:hypothetical protein